MKTKIIAMVEIAVVLCSVFLVAIPAIAAEQNQAVQKASANEVTTASEDDYVLGVYGNANEDDTIDMGDVVYTKLAIFGKKSKTELCDAKYDGRINVLDVIQTKLIILGKEKELTVVDSMDRVVTVKKPIKRMVVAYRNVLETFRSLKVPKDKIVGVSGIVISKYKVYYPEFQDVPTVGNLWNPDTEVILNLNPDVVFLYYRPKDLGATVDVLESAGIPVLLFTCSIASAYKTFGYRYYQNEIKKLGYILDNEKEAEEFIDWYDGVLNPIIEKAGKIPEEEKPKVYYESPFGSYTTYSTHIEVAGSKNIFPDMTGSVDPEAVIAQNPDIIVKLASGKDVTGYYLDAGDTTEIGKVREEIMSRPELQKVKAVKNEKVYVISAYMSASGPQSGPRNFLQIVYNAKWFHPELFEDLDPKTIHQEYLTRFQGLDIDLDEKGVFVYHPEEHPGGN